jgi:hypothetical protein
MSVFWVHANSVLRFCESFCDIAERAKLPGCDEPQADVLRIVHDWLSSKCSGCWLLILNNVDDAQVLSSPRLQGSTAYEAVQQAATGVDGGSARQLLLWCILQSAHDAVLIALRFCKAAHSVIGDYTVVIKVGELREAETVLLLKTKLGLGAEAGATTAAATENEQAPAPTAATYNKADAITVVRMLERVPLTIM